jgi:hypothetical protein
MKDWVNAPLRGKFKAVINCRHHLNDLKRSVSSGHKLGGGLIDTEILAF